MIKHHLLLKTTVIAGEKHADDYCVWCDGRLVGRILFTHVAGGGKVWDWMINPPLPIPAWAKGSASTLDEAKTIFRQAWERFFETLTPENIALWHRTADAKRHHGNVDPRQAPNGESNIQDKVK